jgi:tetratricopeptide (TPR) repeat protein
MNYAELKLLAKRPPVVLAVLLVIAILAFAGVTRLVNRFREQQKALARHLFEHGEAAVAGGNPERAIENFRAALIYWPDNFQGQLTLARALRDTGRTTEAQTYLLGLWEAKPQDGAVNLALGRLYAREKQVDRATQYYHNAIYGEWSANLDSRRRDARFELIDFLLAQDALVPAQAELLSLASVLPANSDLHLQVAQLFLRAQDYGHALQQFQGVLQADSKNAAASSGAGEAAFQLGDFPNAKAYLQHALQIQPENAEAQRRLDLTELVLNADPYARHISQRERDRRIRQAWTQAGERLNQCAASRKISFDSAPGPPWGSLHNRWLTLKPKIERGGGDSGLMDQTMDLVFDIEQQMAGFCGSPAGSDQAFLLLRSQNRKDVGQ